MSRIQRTQDLQALKTRSLVIQNPDNSLPPIKSILTAIDAYGHFAPSLDVSINSINVSDGVFKQVILTDPTTPDPGILSYYDGTLFINDISFNTAGIVGPIGQVGPVGPPGPAGPTGPPFDLSYPFLHNPPAAITNIELPFREITSRPPLPANGPSGTTAEVLILWTNPPQDQFNGFELPMPLITQLNITLTSNLAVTTEIFVTDHLPGAKDAYGIPLTYPITGLRLIKGVGTSGYRALTLPYSPVPVTYGVYDYYVGNNYSNYEDTFTVGVVYTGYLNTDNTFYIPNLSFNFPSSAAASLPNSVNPSVINSSTVQVTWLPPTYSDQFNDYSTGVVGSPTITSYTVTTTPVSSSVRYQGPYDTNPVAGSTSGLTFTAQALYPDTTYAVAVKATNSLGNIGPSSTVSVTTGPDVTLQPTYVDANQSLVPYYPESNLYYQGDPIAPYPALNINSITVGPAGIHTLQNRGSTDADIMTLTVTASGVAPASLAVGGFGQNLTNGGTEDIPIVESGTVDVGIEATTNFYLEAYFDVAVPAVSQPQLIQLEQAFAVSTIPAKKSAITSYYWDTLPNNLSPILGTISLAPISSFVCGIPMIGSPWSLTLTSLPLANMGTVLYVKNPVQYAVFDTSGVVVTDFSVPIPTNITTTFTGSIQAVDYYAVQPELTIAAMNINGFADYSTVALPAVADPLSVGAADVAVAVLDVIGGSVGVRYNSPINTNTIPSTVFNNNTRLTEIFECVLYQGIYWTQANQNAFNDFSSWGGPDYLGLNPSGKGITPGYQYATFLWNGVAGYNSSSALSLSITFTDEPSLTGPSLNFAHLQTAESFGDIDVYYQVTCSGYTSAWINANSTVGRATFTTSSKTLGTPVGGFITGAAVSYHVDYTLLLPTPYVSAGSRVLVAVGLSPASSTGIQRVACSYA